MAAVEHGLGGPPAVFFLLSMYPEEVQAGCRGSRTPVCAAALFTGGGSDRRAGAVGWTAVGHASGGVCSLEGGEIPTHSPT